MHALTHLYREMTFIEGRALPRDVARCDVNPLVVGQIAVERTKQSWMPKYLEPRKPRSRYEYRNRGITDMHDHTSYTVRVRLRVSESDGNS